MVRRTLWCAALGLISWALAGCGADDAGPGVAVISFESPVVIVGAAVVEITGAGVLGVEATGGSRAIGSTTATGTIRVVVASTTDESPVLRVPILDRRAALPVVVLIQAVDQQNRALASTAQVQVRVRLDG